MVGEGSHNIWLEEFGDPASPDIGTNYQIITINNTDHLSGRGAGHDR